MSFLDTMMLIQDEITLFGDNPRAQSPEYVKITKEKFALRQRLLQCCGPEIEELLDEYTEVVESQEDLIAEYYFEQGFQAGQRQKQKNKKKPS